MTPSKCPLVGRPPWSAIPQLGYTFQGTARQLVQTRDVMTTLRPREKHFVVSDQQT